MDFDLNDSSESWMKMSDELFDRTSNLNAIRREVQAVKESLQSLYRQINSYDIQKDELQEDFEKLRKANREYALRLKDAEDVYRSPPAVRVEKKFTTTPSYSRRYSYESVSSKGSSSGYRYTNHHHSGVTDDYDDNLSDDYSYDERTFTKSVEHFEFEDTSDA